MAKALTQILGKTDISYRRTHGIALEYSRCLTFHGIEEEELVTAEMLGGILQMFTHGFDIYLEAKPQPKERGVTKCARPHFSML